MDKNVRIWIQRAFTYTKRHWLAVLIFSLLFSLANIAQAQLMADIVNYPSAVTEASNVTLDLFKLVLAELAVVLVANLAPRKMRGIMSEGMLLCAEDAEGHLHLITSDAAPGSSIS